MPYRRGSLLMVLLVAALVLDILGAIALTVAPPEEGPIGVGAAVVLVALAIAIGSAIYLARPSAKREKQRSQPQPGRSIDR